MKNLFGKQKNQETEIVDAKEIPITISQKMNVDRIDQIIHDADRIVDAVPAITFSPIAVNLESNNTEYLYHNAPYVNAGNMFAALVAETLQSAGNILYDDGSMNLSDEEKHNLLCSYGNEIYSAREGLIGLVVDRYQFFVQQFYYAIANDLLGYLEYMGFKTCAEIEKVTTLYGYHSPMQFIPNIFEITKFPQGSEARSMYIQHVRQSLMGYTVPAVAQEIFNKLSVYISHITYGQTVFVEPSSDNEYSHNGRIDSLYRDSIDHLKFTIDRCIGQMIYEMSNIGSMFEMFSGAIISEDESAQVFPDHFYKDERWYRNK